MISQSKRFTPLRFAGFLLCRHVEWYGPGMDDHDNLWPGIHPEDSSIFLRPGRRSARNQYVARRNGTPLRGLRGIYSDNGTSKMPKLENGGQNGVFFVDVIDSYHVQLLSRVFDVELK